MPDSDLVKSVWDIANTVVGFAVAQSLLFSYACAQKDVGDALNRKRIKAAIAIMLILIAALQSTVIAWCRGAMCALDAVHCTLYSEVNLGRHLINVSACLFALVILYTRQLFARKPFDESPERRVATV